LPRIEHPVLASALEAFFVAAIPEEFFKLVVLLFYCMRKEAFDEPMDGIVYGVVASLGFAALENLLYVVDGGTGVAFSRAFTAVPLHAFLGAIMGYYVGQAWKNPARRTALIVRGYGIAVLLHGVYDFPLMTMNALEGEPELLLAAATLVVLLHFVELGGPAQPGPPTGTIGAYGDPGGTGRQRCDDGSDGPFPRDTGDADRRGVISASMGGMVVFGLLLSFFLGIVAVDDTTDVVSGGVLIGVLPLVAGGLFFRYGVRGLNNRGI